MKNNTNSNIFWHGWKTEASKHFEVSNPTISNWFNENNPELIAWLKDRLIARKKDQINSENNKNEVIKLAEEMNL